MVTGRDPQGPDMGFVAYFNAADELWPEAFQVEPLTLDDLDPAAVHAARAAATRLALPWPPYLPDAEEFALANPGILG
jgi:hypothetical protein